MMKVSMYVPMVRSLAEENEEDSLLALGHYLTRMGADVSFFTFSKGGGVSSGGYVARAETGEGKALKLYDPTVIRIIGMLPQFYSRELVRDMVAEKSDILHIQGMPWVSLLLPILRKVKCPVVLSPLFLFDRPQTVPPKLGSKLLRYSFARLRKRVSRFISESPEAKSWLLQRGTPDSKISSLHHAIDYYGMSRIPRREEEMIISVGRYLPHKGLHILIEAAKMMLETYPQLTCNLVGSPGDPEYHGLLKESVRGYEGQINVTGPLEEASLLDLFSRAKFLVFPSLEDTHGFIILETMAAGIPVIATRVAATAALIDDGVNGVVVPPNNASLLAESMVSLWKDKVKRAALAGNGRKTAKQFYWEEYAMKLVRIYREILSSPGS